MKCTSSMIPNEFVGCILGNVQNVKGRLGPGTGNVNKTFPSTAFPSISFLNSAVVLTSSFAICQSFTFKVRSWTCCWMRVTRSKVGMFGEWLWEGLDRVLETDG